MKLSQSDAVEIISKLQKGEGTDAQQEEWMDCIKNSFPFYVHVKKQEHSHPDNYLQCIIDTPY